MVCIIIVFMCRIKISSELCCVLIREAVNGDMIKFWIVQFYVTNIFVRISSLVLTWACLHFCCHVPPSHCCVEGSSQFSQSNLHFLHAQKYAEEQEDINITQIVILGVYYFDTRLLKEIWQVYGSSCRMIT